MFKILLFLLVVYLIKSIGAPEIVQQDTQFIIARNYEGIPLEKYGVTYEHAPFASKKEEFENGAILSSIAFYHDKSESYAITFKVFFWSKIQFFTRRYGIEKTDFVAKIRLVMKYENDRFHFTPDEENIVDDGMKLIDYLHYLDEFAFTYKATSKEFKVFYNGNLISNKIISPVSFNKLYNILKERARFDN